MALKLKYTDEHGIVHINMSPNSSPQSEIKDPKFDTINNRFGNYDLFGGKYEDYKTDSSGEAPHSLFRSRYNSIEEELANTPYAFATERSLRSANQLDITIDRTDISPSKDIEDDRFFQRRLSLDYEDVFRDGPAFTVTQLIHAQDRYFDLSSREKESENKAFVLKETPFPKAEKSGHKSAGFIDKRSEKLGRNLVDKSIKIVERSGQLESLSAGVERTFVEKCDSQSDSSADRTVPVREDSAFQVLRLNSDVDTQTDPIATTVVPISVRKKEKSFAILTETPIASRPTSPRSLPVDIRHERVSPFKGRGFREETSRHNTPRTSAANSRASSPPPRRRTSSLSRIEDNMASTATLPPPILLPTHSPRNFLRENMKGVKELSELNREKHEAEAEQKKIEEETAILKEMGLTEKAAKKEAARSLHASKNNSRSNSPSKLNLRSRSSSPSTNLNKSASKSKVFINANDGMPKPVTHKSRVRSVSKSQPQSNDGSPKSSKIPKRQSSLSPKRGVSKKDPSIYKRPLNHKLIQEQKYLSSSTSSIHETIRIGSSIHDKRNLSQSAQHLSISPALIKGKPPISPGRGGPPPSNRAINAKRLSPIVGTPSKSPIDDSKIGTKTGAKTTITKRPVKTTGNTPATSRLTSRQPSRDPSPDKRKTTTKPSTTKPGTNPTKPISRTPSTKSIQKPATPAKTEPKKPITRTDSMKSLTRTSSTKNLASKPPLKRSDSKLSNKSASSGKINDLGRKDSTKDKDKEKKVAKSMSDSATDPEEIPKQDSETQYDKITNAKGELVIMTKKSIVSMTTAAITSQPLEIVTTVTNQLPVTLEKAREKRNIERLSSKESLIGKDEVKIVDEKKKTDRTHGKNKKEAKEEKDQEKPTSSDDNHKLRPLQPPFNDPQLEKVKQKIDDILKTPEISRENILTPAKPKDLPRQESRFKNFAEKTKTDVKETKDSITDKLTDLKNQMAKQQQEAASTSETITSEIRTEATKIVDSIITPVEEPKAEVVEKVEEVKKDIEPIVMVVNEKKKDVPEKKKDVPEKKKEVPEKKKEPAEIKKDVTDAVEKVNEALVKGEPEVEVLSSNVSTPGIEKMAMAGKMADGNGSDKSQSNGGFPQSTSTTPKPPARTKKEQKEKEKEKDKELQSPPPESEVKSVTEDGEHKKSNICSRLMGKCKSKCCPCCIKGEDEKETEELTERRERDRTEERIEGDKMQKQGMMSKFSCCKKKKPEVEEVERDMERAAGKGATIEFEDETKRKRKLRDIICCCGRRRRVTDAAIPPQNVADVTMSPREMEGVVTETGCCGKKRQVERRDSILSDRAPASCCARLSTWFRGMCRRREPQAPSSRRASMFSKNKSLSPTLPPEDTRKKLDPSLIEHTSIIRAAVPILPIVLAYFCLVCNIIVPGLGSIFSGLFCLCFGIPRFGPHDGAKYRIGAFVINLLVGAGQLFTVLFCLVGWGWSIWWGVIMVKISRKYRRLKREAAIAEAEAAPPVTANNHTRA